MMRVCRLAALVAAWGHYIQTGDCLTILPGGEPKLYNGTAGVTNAEDFFRKSAPNEFFNNTADIIMMSMDDSQFTADDTARILPSGESFIRGAIQAWGEHLHLVIRPEEVWFTVLTQMNFFMSSHAEEVRSIFVGHQGKELMYLEDTEWFRVIQDFKNEIEGRIRADWFADWLFPRWSTTNTQDGMIATVLMMGLTKAYFKFEGGIICGLPSVTLVGQQADWEDMLARLDRLPLFGPEPAAYRDRLRPIIARFVASFRDPDSAATKAFWNSIVLASPSHVCGSPPYYMSGWLGGFFYWDDKGRPYARDPAPAEHALTLDNATYPRLDLRTLPVGYARAPFLLHEFNGTQHFPAYVMGGTLGKQITPGPPDGYAEALQRVAKNGTAVSGPAALSSGQHSTLQPMSAWMLYGPANHNATDVRWVKEPELSDLFTFIGSNFNESQCDANHGEE